MPETKPVERPRDRHPRVYAPSGGPRLTKDEFRREADLNLQLRRYLETETRPADDEQLREFFVDLDGPQSLQEALDLVEQADELFASLPAAVREACDNDPLRLAEMAQDPKELHRLSTLDLRPAKSLRSSQEPQASDQGATPEQATKSPESGAQDAS